MLEIVKVHIKMCAQPQSMIYNAFHKQHIPWEEEFLKLEESNHKHVMQTKKRKIVCGANWETTEGLKKTFIKVSYFLPNLLISTSLVNSLYF